MWADPKGSSSGSCHSEKLKLDDGIASLRVSEEAGTSLNEFPLSVVFLLKNEPEAEATRISEEPCRAENIIKCQRGSSSQALRKASVCVASQRKSFLGLRRGRRGDSAELTLSELLVS